MKKLLCVVLMLQMHGCFSMLGKLPRRLISLSTHAQRICKNTQQAKRVCDSEVRRHQIAQELKANKWKKVK